MQVILASRKLSVIIGIRFEIITLCFGLHVREVLNILHNVRNNGNVRAVP